jgi:hypothetical protein
MGRLDDGGSPMDCAPHVPARLFDRASEDVGRKFVQVTLQLGLA